MDREITLGEENYIQSREISSEEEEWTYQP